MDIFKKVESMSSSCTFNLEQIKKFINEVQDALQSEDMKKRASALNAASKFMNLVKKLDFCEVVHFDLSCDSEKDNTTKH